jgi:tetratricopeptide (TPR) repeat protein
MNVKKAVIILLLLISAAAARAGQDDYGTETLFVLGTGARAAGMGGAFTALAVDSSGSYYNPAGLARLPRQEISLLHYPLYSDTLYNSVVYAAPILDFGTIGAGVYRIHSDNVQFYSADDFAAGTGGFDEYKAGISYARGITDEIALGVNVNIYSISLAQTKSYGLGADLGVFYAPFSFLQLGGVIHNFLEPTFSMKYENENLLQDYTIGAAYLLRAGPFLTSFALDMDKPQEAQPRVRAGAEVTAFDSVSARAGFDENRFTLGAGLKLYGFAVDYACIFNADTGYLSRFAISYSFGQGIPEQKEERMKAAMREVKGFVEAELNKKTMEEAEKNYGKAQDLYKKGMYEAALKAVDQALGWNSSHAGAASLRKTLLAKLLDGNYKTAVAKYKEKDYLNSLTGFMQVRQVDENFKDTINYINKINDRLEISGESGRLFNEGMAYFVNKDYDSAIQRWTSALNAKPELKFLKQYIRKAEETKTRSGAGRELSASDLERVRDLNYAGVNKYIKGDLEGAIAEWQKALDIDPGNIEVTKNFESANNVIKELKKRGFKQ